MKVALYDNCKQFSTSQSEMAVVFRRPVKVEFKDDKSSFDVYPEPERFGRTFTVKTLHVSCKSDTYHGSDCKYGGIIMYARNNQGEWHTVNNTECKSGYVVITRTDTTEFQKLKEEWKDEPGQVHGVIYRKAFGESLKDVTAIGEGFSVLNGSFEQLSGTLNTGQCAPNYHSGNICMHEDSARVVKALVTIWKDAGPNVFASQNYTVKELYRYRQPDAPVRSTGSSCHLF